MRSNSTRLVLIIIAANLGMFILDRAVAPGAAPLSLVVSAAALTAISGRGVLRPPVVAAAVALVGLTLVELVDRGALPVLRIRL